MKKMYKGAFKMNGLLESILKSISKNTNYSYLEIKRSYESLNSLDRLYMALEISQEDNISLEGATHFLLREENLV